jgi:hypothetical protein
MKVSSQIHRAITPVGHLDLSPLLRILVVSVHFVHPRPFLPSGTLFDHELLRTPDGVEPLDWSSDSNPEKGLFYLTLY